MSMSLLHKVFLFEELTLYSLPVCSTIISLRPPSQSYILSRGSSVLCSDILLPLQVSMMYKLFPDLTMVAQMQRALLLAQFSILTCTLKHSLTHNIYRTCKKISYCCMHNILIKLRAYNDSPFL